MIKGTVTRDDRVWQGHPDVAYFNDTLFIVFRKSDRHLTAKSTAIQLVSKSPNRSFTPPETIWESTNRLNCPRLSVIGNTLWLICDEIERSDEYIKAENDEDKTKVLLWKSQNGFDWEGPLITNITGIVPDRICPHDNGYLIATHTMQPRSLENPESDGYLVQNVWFSENLGSEWTKFPLCHDARYNFCEASICRFKKKYFCLLRENSGLGLPAFACHSSDGITWLPPFKTRMFGCHRPVIGVLKSGDLLTTYREASHSFRQGYWAKNTFACLTRHYDLSGDLNSSIILPLDHDKSKHSDSGYTGWVQLPDHSIFIVNYITDGAPKPYIRWYQIHENEF